MGINPTSLATQSIETDYNVVIEMVATRPTVGVLLETQMTPNKILGYYDAALDAVKLYIVSDSGFVILAVS